MAKSVIINGVTYEGVPYVSIPTTADGKTKAKFVDTDDANAAAADLRAGKTAYIGGNKVTGTISSMEAVDVTVNGKTVTIPAGIYDTEVKKSAADGTVTPNATVSGTVIGDTTSAYEISVTPSADVNAGWIAEGKTGTVVKKYVQVEEKTATPTISAQTITPSNGKLISKVTVNAVNLDATATEADVMAGKTFYAGGLTKKTGTATVPVVGQDTTTKALTIS